MTFRTNEFAVRDLLQDPDAEVHAFVAVANELVTEWLSASGLSSRMLTQIESFLACHFYLLSNPELVREEYDRARFQYAQAQVGEGFGSTKWGQMAMALDTTGTLRGANKVPANLYVL